MCIGASYRFQHCDPPARAKRMHCCCILRAAVPCVATHTITFACACRVVACGQLCVHAPLGAPLATRACSCALSNGVGRSMCMQLGQRSVLLEVLHKRRSSSHEHGEIRYAAAPLCLVLLSILTCHAEVASVHIGHHRSPRRRVPSCRWFTTTPRQGSREDTDVDPQW